MNKIYTYVKEKNKSGTQEQEQERSDSISLKSLKSLFVDAYFNLSSYFFYTICRIPEFFQFYFFMSVLSSGRNNDNTYIIKLIQVLDFRKIKQKEKESSKSLFKSKEGKTQLKDIQQKAKTFVPGSALPEATNKPANPAGLTADQVRAKFRMFLTEFHTKKVVQTFRISAEVLCVDNIICVLCKNF